MAPLLPPLFLRLMIQTAWLVEAARFWYEHEDRSARPPALGVYAPLILLFAEVWPVTLDE